MALLLLLAGLCVSCAQLRGPTATAQNEAEALRAGDCPPQVYTDKLLTVGAVERVLLEPQGAILQARIDTGAAVSSIDAQDVTPFERDGKPWVKFRLPLRETGKDALQIETPVTRKTRIKRHDAPSEDRLVVTLRVVLGPADRLSEFTLADRANYEYPVLIGRNYLQGLAMVDVDRKLTLPPKPDPAGE